MPTSYHECPQQIADMAHGLRRKNHSELEEADVTICYLWARNDTGPAITYRGWPAKALVRINNLRDRVAGLADATILIDEELFSEMTDASQLSLLDHELHHLEVRRDKEGAVAVDDVNRPKLRIRPHDFNLGGFHLMADRWGKESHEAQGYMDLTRVWHQASFNFDDDGEAVEAAATSAKG